MKLEPNPSDAPASSGLEPSSTCALLRDQRRILDRLRKDLSRPYLGDPAIQEFEAELSSSEEHQIAGYLAEFVEISKANQVCDMRGERVCFDARDFGATGDGRHDDRPALQAAVDEAVRHGKGAVLSVPPGTYRLSLSQEKNGHLCLDGARDIILEGEPGAVLVGTSHEGAVLRLNRCRNVRLRNLALDLDPLPCAQGQIEDVAANRGSLIWRIEEGFAQPDEPPFSARENLLCNAIDAGTGLHSEGPSGGHYSAERFDPLGDRRWRVHRPDGQSFPPKFQPGMHMILNTRRKSRHAFAISDCEWIDCENVNVHASYEFAVLVESSVGTAFRRCHVGPMPGTGRVCGISADGFHCRSNRYGPFFEECRIERVLDDCFNLYSRMVSLDDTPDERTLVLDVPWKESERKFHWQPLRRDFRPGDMLLLLDPSDGSPTGWAVIASLESREWRGRNHLAVRLDRPLHSLKSRESLGLHEPVRTNSHFLSLKETRLEHFVVNLSTKSDGFVIRDCVFGNNTITGGKIKASNGLIANNRSWRHGWCCLSLAMEANWQEGFAPRRILIENNSFESWFGIFTGSHFPPERWHPGPAYGRQIEIRGNRFTGKFRNEYCIDFNGLADCEVEDNVFPGDRPVAIGPTATDIRFGHNRVGT